MSRLQIHPLTHTQQVKVDRDLQYINFLTNYGKKHGIRVIVSGGYATDANFGVITRYHEDIDIQLYSKNTNGFDEIAASFYELGKKEAFYVDIPIIDKGIFEFYHEFDVKKDDFHAVFYYLPVKTDPFAEEKIILKKDGSHSPSHRYETVQGKMGYEIAAPLPELVDKIYKREYRGDPKLEKHEQDIFNLRTITHEKDVENRLKTLLTPHI
ncbi:MAG: hypothetical protein V1917_02135 [Candidatus Gottesmanbacteria bacterium]